MSEFDDLETEIRKLKERMNKLLNNYSEYKTESMEETEWSPDIDILEDKDYIIVILDIPGISVNDIDTTITGNLLQIKGERKRRASREDENYHFIGRKYGSFNRNIELPTQIDVENIKAVYKDGVLTIKLPKLEKIKSERLRIELT
ncbi:TPA: Hsp20/alpha crystallin family protein [Candidatus Poribacteria bacterium]|nr:Hsp20/alpha crystallin family protein [Candidatus Poribacteria bacterium]